MDDKQRALWESILLGHAAADALDVELLLAAADDDDIRWVVRGFEPGAGELLVRWQTYNAANMATESTSDQALIEMASRWAAEVAQSAQTFGLDHLVAQCAMAGSIGQRPSRSEQLDYLDWIARVNDAVMATPQQVGAAELCEAYWGATNFHEFVWYLAAPLCDLPVDPTPCVELLGAGGLCWITTAGPVVKRFR